MPITIIFIISIFLSGIIRLIFNYLTLYISSSIGSDLSILSFRNTINRPYSYHLYTNSNILITTIAGDINEIIYFIFNPIFHLIGSIIISITIGITLLKINFIISSSSIFITIIFYFILLNQLLIL